MATKDFAPPGVLQKNQFFWPITKGLIERSARLFNIAYRHTFGDVVFNSYISNDKAIPNSIDREIPLRQLKWRSRTTIKQVNCIINQILERLGGNSAK